MVKIIPPLLFNNKLISDFKLKANYFNDFFASQCTPLHNNRKIPETYVTKLNCHQVNLRARKLVIRSLDVNKAHGHDSISIRILKICDSATGSFQPNSSNPCQVKNFKILEIFTI